jgi:hypothetical protein
MVSVDSEGTIAGQSVNVSGVTVTRAPAPGKIKVNADCSAVVTWDFGTVGSTFVLDEGREMRGMAMQSAMGKPVWLGTWKRISRIPNTVEPAQCLASAVSGVYGYTSQGNVMMSQAGLPQPVPVPSALVGMVSIASDGSVAGPGFSSMGGDMMQFEMVNSTVSMSTDCTGTLKWSMQGLAGQGEDWFVVLDGGKEVWSISTKGILGQPIAVGSWNRISPIPWTK